MTRTRIFNSLFQLPVVAQTPDVSSLFDRTAFATSQRRWSRGRSPRQELSALAQASGPFDLRCRLEETRSMAAIRHRRGDAVLADGAMLRIRPILHL
jgi:hypothetical protein